MRNRGRVILRVAIVKGRSGERDGWCHLGIMIECG